MKETERWVEESRSVPGPCLGICFPTHTGKAVSPNTGPGTATGSGMGCDPNETLRNEERHVRNFQERSFLALKNASWTHLLSHTLFGQKQESTFGFLGRMKRENETKS